MCICILYIYVYIYVVKMDEKERKYLHLRMLINDIKLNCYKINPFTAEAVRIKRTRNILSYSKDGREGD